MTGLHFQLASLLQRVLAFVVDMCVILVGLAGFQCLPISTESAIAIFVALFVGYHYAILLNPNFGIGRVIAGITVIARQQSRNLAQIQCLTRPCIRVAWAITGFLLARSLRSISSIAVMALFLPLLIDLALITFHRARQSVADLLCDTIVVILPPPQPHRAPAAPMFSASDAEFGYPPKK